MKNLLLPFIIIVLIIFKISMGDDGEFKFEDSDIYVVGDDVDKLNREINLKTQNEKIIGAKFVVEVFSFNKIFQKAINFRKFVTEGYFIYQVRLKKMQGFVVDNQTWPFV